MWAAVAESKGQKATCPTNGRSQVSRGPSGSSRYVLKLDILGGERLGAIGVGWAKEMTASIEMRRFLVMLPNDDRRGGQGKVWRMEDGKDRAFQSGATGIR